MIGALALYLLLACRQLGLPGLHYDEAREAGVNAMELLTGAPVNAFRGASMHLGDFALPLMVQDYIGALNVYLSLPFLAVTGIGVPNLRILSVLIGLLTLLALERAVSEWLATRRERTVGAPELSVGGLVAMTLAAASPAFVFWSRQGIFVTNLMQLGVMLSLWLGVRWLRTESSWALVICALTAGFALYAKLMAVWVLLPFVLLVAGGWFALWRAGKRSPPGWGALLGAVVAFAISLIPLLIFNLQTQGTWIALTGNLGSSYYGVENTNLLGNLGVRAPQLWQVFEGSFLWYLGGIQANPVAPWLALVLVGLGLMTSWRRVLPPLLVLIGAFALSLVTISDLFITHYALLQVVGLGVVGVAAGVLWQWLSAKDNASALTGRWLFAAVVTLWLLLDLRATLAYHGDLARTGGLADHSDASYALAYHLEHNGMGAPIALDWGMDATVRYLSRGRVTPVEIFGYESPAAPDAAFADRLALFSGNPENVYLLHAPGSEVFAGRRAHFEQLAAEHNLTPVLEITFSQRDGAPLYEIWRLEPAALQGR